MNVPSYPKRSGESGQAMVLFALALVMLMGVLALVIDGGVLRRSSQEQWNALDAGALAGAASLPADPVKARSDAIKFALQNHPGLSPSAITVTYRCLVGDRNGDGLPDASDVPAVCNPGAGASWSCGDGICVAACNPFSGGVCNTVVVEGTVDTDYVIGPVTGIQGASTDIISAACSGLCGGEPVSPLDVMIVIDRSGSMSSTDLTNVRNATLATLRLFDPEWQHVGLALLGPSRTTSSSPCPTGALGISTSSTPNTWVTVPYPTTGSLSNNYQNSDGTLNLNSQLVRTVNCFNSSSTGTNLGDPLRAAADVLIARGRPDTTKGIIFMTDGAANEPNSSSCKYAYDQATVAKARGIELFTIGFGVGTDTCSDATGSPYRSARVTRLLADMATQVTLDNGCTQAENEDGDHFFCEPRTDSLASVFKAAASALLDGSVRLVPLP